MAIRNILRFGDETLRKRSREVVNIDDRVVILVEDLKDTLAAADGAGLAAPQVGILKRVVIVDMGGDIGPVELINPEIVKQSGHQEEVEGCLSNPGEYGITSRPMKVMVKALNVEGKPVKYTCEGLSARCVCHEVDHLDGILFTDNVIRMLSDDEMEK